MKMNRDVEYALMALKSLQDTGGGLSASEIAREHRISESLLKKILQKLKRAEILESAQGVTGGYTTAKPLESVTLNEIFTAMHGSASLMSCAEKKNCPVFSTCTIKGFMHTVDKKWTEVLGSLSLSQLLEAR